MVLAWLLAAPLAGAASVEAGPEVEYSAPAACPDAAELQREILARLPPAALRDTERFRFRVTIVAGTDRYDGTVQMLAPRASATRRRVDHADCSELGRVLAFIIAVLIDPRSEPHAEPVGSARFPAAPQVENGSPAAPAATAVVVPAPLAAPVPTEAAPRREPSAIRVAASSALALDTALVPGLAVMPRLSAGLRYDRGERLGGSLGLSVGFGQSSTLREAGADADISWTLFRPQACGLAHPVPEAAVEACGTFELGQVRGSGSFERSASWAAPGVLARAGWFVIGPLELAAELGVYVPLVRPHFYFTRSGRRETVHRVPDLGFTAGLGLGLSFP